MAEYLSEFVTNLAMPPAVRPVPHQFAMGDNNAYTFTALLCDARNPDAELMAGTVSGSLLRPDGTTVALGGTKGAAVRRVNLDGGGMCNATPCSVTLPQACFAYPGRVTLVITLVDGTTITQALAVSAVVARTSTDAVVDPGDLVPDVDELQAIATELTAAVGGAVRFDEAQTLTDAQKAQARANIGAGEGGGGTVTGAVRYDTAQTLTDAEKTQAQTNIGAADALMVAGEMAVDRSGASNAYIAAAVGEAITIRSSGTSITYRKVCRVKHGGQYALYVLNADPAANTGGRVVCIADEEGVVLQKLSLATTAGRWNVLGFTAAGDGWLYVCVDRNCLDMKIRHGAVWEIEKSIAPVEPGKATTAHATGELLVMDGRLYRAVSGIAAGEDITAGAGGNVTGTTVAEQLAALEVRIAALENA